LVKEVAQLREEVDQLREQLDSLINWLQSSIESRMEGLVRFQPRINTHEHGSSSKKNPCLSVSICG
jgi:uncharacterized coiled-coil protein SlyX